MHNNKSFKLCLAFAALMMCFPGMCFAAEVKPVSLYDQWKSVGKLAAQTSLEMMKKAGAAPRADDLVVMSNAGYAEVNGLATPAALDGLTAVTNTSRGAGTLVEIHSAYWNPLWFAVYDKASGRCVYTELDAAKASGIGQASFTASATLFGVQIMERIDAAYVYRNAQACKTRFDQKIFGGNEFRIVTIMNAAAAGAPADVMRALEFHDHYCPGVTSGILMARYIKKFFPAGTSGYFVHSVQPWCKEDALLVILNATPGRRGYAVSYPSKADIEGRPAALKDAATIIYRLNEDTKRWEGMVLAFAWSKTDCKETGNTYTDKLCEDLWYLKHLDSPENCVKDIKRFELPDGTTPKDWARPGVDPLVMLAQEKL